jgi:two-component system sensor histidine kinase BaeS
VTRRLTLTIVGAVVGTLLLAGVGTLALARFGARQVTRDQLVDQVDQIASVVGTGVPVALTPAQRRAELASVIRAFRLEDVGFALVGPGGAVLTGVDGRPGLLLPAGVTEADLDLDRLQAGETVSGSHGSLVFAAAAGKREAATVVVVATRRVDAQLGPALRWFLLASLVTVAVGALVAWRLGRRLTSPLRQATEATGRIAAGDLGTRLPDPPPAADDEIADLARSINAMAGALERSKGLERQFLLSVSHDLRTPLTSIRGYAEAIGDGAVEDPAAAASVILAESRRLERLVRDLLDLATLDGRQFSLVVEPVDLAAVAHATADGFRPDATDAGVAITVDAAQPAMVDADADRLGQVAANLVENALKFARSRVHLAVVAGNGWGVLAVDDDGPGIAPEDRPHVFERLYVARRDPRRAETGSGLGLAIVRELVTAMGGTVAVDASPMAGARITVQFPLRSTPVSASPASPPSATVLGGETVV